MEAVHLAGLDHEDVARSALESSSADCPHSTAFADELDLVIRMAMRTRPGTGLSGVSVFLFQGKPGSGPGPHRHPYDEIQFIREGRGVWTVGGRTFEGGAGDIFVIKAGEVHSFQAVGDSPLIQVDVHLSSRFIQENL